jgi:ribonuclease BN (tRNA processing enzyme)
MRLIPLGVRGSTAAPGTAFARYGGHTSCVAVLADHEEAPSLLLDAGTGLRTLPRLLDDRPFHGSIVLSHLHWDHVQGLPFCRSLDHPEAVVDVFVPGEWTPASSDEDARGLVAESMSPPHFPITPEGLLGAWRFRPARPGVLPPDLWAVEGTAAVRVVTVPHKGGATLGVRVECDGSAIAYLPDHAPSEGDGALEALVAGVDVLLHDGQFHRGEEATARAYGHSTIDEAMLIADRYGVGRLVVVHHDPSRSDVDLDAMAAAVPVTPGGRPVSFAVEGLPINVPQNMHVGELARGDSAISRAALSRSRL